MSPVATIFTVAMTSALLISMSLFIMAAVQVSFN